MVDRRFAQRGHPNPAVRRAGYLHQPSTINHQPAAAAALVLAAGRGTRMGAAVPDKVWAPLGGVPVLLHSLRAFERAPSVGRVVVVVREETRAAARALVEGDGLGKVVAVVVGGDRRRDSVLAGLNALEDADVILVHDAARPLVDQDTIERGVELARAHGAALPAVPVRDTIKRVIDGRVVETPSRAELWSALTPQCFRLELLREAHAASADDATDDCVLVERLGHPVVVYPASARNIKITLAEDLRIAEALLAGG
ncbi:MAG TPA: 2-C-methyl-D-erythritol 4-phosphate cytidylyltransferase [Chloroflexota bacterium]|jgi:2-C-methyl-D-erythritol 4-phosphate cytidylyltransferase